MQLASGILIFTCLLLAICSAQEDFGLKAEVDATIAELQEQLDEVRHRLMPPGVSLFDPGYLERLKKGTQLRRHKEGTCSVDKIINGKLYLLADGLPRRFYVKIKRCCRARWGETQAPGSIPQNVEDFCQCIDQVNSPKITEFLGILNECPAEYGARQSEDDALTNEVRDALVAGRL